MRKDLSYTPLEMAGEKTDPKVRAEISDLMLIMENWRKSYATWCTKGEDNEWVYREFWEEITTHLQPYAHALHRVEAISYYGGQCLMAFAFDKVTELKNEFK